MGFDVTISRTAEGRFRRGVRSRRIVPSLAALAGAAAIAAGGGMRAGSEAEALGDAAVRSVWSALDSAWNEREAQRFGDLFTADASFEIGGQGALVGREAIRRSFSERFPRLAPDLRHRTIVKEVQEIAPQVRSVDGGVEILRQSAGAPTVVRRFALVAVMLETPEGWRIRLLRAFPQPDAEGEGVAGRS